MKKNEHPLTFNKNSIIELNDNQLFKINGGTSIVRPLTKETSTEVCETFGTVTITVNTNTINPNPTVAIPA